MRMLAGFRVGMGNIDVTGPVAEITLTFDLIQWFISL